MRLGFNGATTQTANLATDIRVAGQAGYEVIELRDGKLDQFLAQGSLDDVRRMLREARVAAWTINAIDRVGVDGEAGPARAGRRSPRLARPPQPIHCPLVPVSPVPPRARP